ncbi:MAG: LrgB family protein [Aeromonas sp.]
MLWFALPLTFMLYGLTRRAARRWSFPLINPVLLPALVLMVLIAGLDLALADYQRGTWPITVLLEPAVVALALPLYRLRAQIRAKLGLILACCSLSVLIAVGSALGLGWLLDTPLTWVASLATRSITTPMAMSVSQALGGIASVAAAVVVLVGILGALIGYPLLRLLRVTDPAAQGLAMGACAHAIGTAVSTEQGAIQGAFASLAMVLCGVLTALLAPVIFALYRMGLGG